MNQAIDITALQEMIGGAPVQYHEIVRNEKAAQCVARWPLLAQIQGGAAVAPADTTALRAIGMPPVRHADLTIAAVTAAPAASFAPLFSPSFAPVPVAVLAPALAPVSAPVAEQVPAFAPLPQVSVMPEHAPERTQERAPAAAPAPKLPIPIPALNTRPVKSNQLLSMFKRLELPTVAENDFAH